jgi:phage shock protein A
MHIFQFLKHVIRKIMEPAEDPSKTGRFSVFDRYIQLLKELDEALSEVEKARQQLKKKSQQLRGRALNVFLKAERAVAEDNEELARIALSRRQMILCEIEKLNQKILEIDKEKERLILIQHRMAARLEIYLTKHDILSACQTAAQAHTAVGEAVKGIAKDSAELNQALELAEKNKKDVQDRAEAIDAFLRSGNLDNLSIFGADLADLKDSYVPSGGQMDVEIEKELAAIKKKIRQKKGGRPQSGQPPSKYKG